MMIIMGLPDKAIDLINKNSVYHAYTKHDKPIGCNKSSGLIIHKSTMYKLEKVGSEFIPLFKHEFKDGTFAIDKLQTVVNNNVYIYLEYKDKAFKWNKNKLT